MFMVRLIDAEGALNDVRTSALGVKLEGLLTSLLDRHQLKRITMYWNFDEFQVSKEQVLKRLNHIYEQVCAGSTDGSKLLHLEDSGFWRGLLT